MKIQTKGYFKSCINKILPTRVKEWIVQFLWIPDSPKPSWCSGIDRNYSNIYHWLWNIYFQLMIGLHGTNQNRIESTDQLWNIYITLLLYRAEVLLGIKTSHIRAFKGTQDGSLGKVMRYFENKQLLSNWCLESVFKAFHLLSVGECL